MKHIFSIGNIRIPLLIFLMIFSLQKSDAQVTDTTRSTASIIMPIILLESMAFEMSAISYINYGSEFLGVVYGGSSIGLLTLTTIYNIKSDYQHAQKVLNYSFAIPYSIGLAALSYYNFRYSDEHSKPQRFWNNVIGLNASILASFATVLVVDKWLINKKINLSFKKNQIGLSYNF